MLSIQHDPTPDLNPDTLGALSQLMLAQAQEMFVHKAMHGMYYRIKYSEMSLIQTKHFLSIKLQYLDIKVPIDTTLLQEFYMSNYCSYNNRQ